MKTPTFRIVAFDTCLSGLSQVDRRAFLKEVRSTWGFDGNLPSHVLVMDDNPSPLSAKIDELISLLRTARLLSLDRSESEERASGVQIEFRQRAVLANGSRISFRDKGCRGIFRFAFLRGGFSIADLFRVLELWRVPDEEKLLNRVRSTISHVNRALRDCGLPIRITREVGETCRWLLEAPRRLEMKSNLKSWAGNPTGPATAENDEEQDEDALRQIEAMIGDTRLAESYILLTASPCSTSESAPERLELLRLEHQLAIEFEALRLAKNEIATRALKRPGFWTGASEAIRNHERAMEHISRVMARIGDALQGKTLTPEETRFKEALAAIATIKDFLEKGLQAKALKLVRSTCPLQEVVQSFVSDCRERVEKEIEAIRKHNPDWNKNGLELTGLSTQADIWLTEIIRQGFDGARCTSYRGLCNALKRRLRDKARRKLEENGLSSRENRLADELKGSYDQNPAALDAEIMKEKGWSLKTYLKAEESYQKKYRMVDSPFIDELPFGAADEEYPDVCTA